MPVIARRSSMACRSGTLWKLTVDRLGSLRLDLLLLLGVRSADSMPFLVLAGPAAILHLHRVDGERVLEVHVRPEVFGVVQSRVRNIVFLALLRSPS